MAYKIKEVHSGVKINYNMITIECSMTATINSNDKDPEQVQQELFAKNYLNAADILNNIIEVEKEKQKQEIVKKENK